jgi:hypothetical protein
MYLRYAYRPYYDKLIGNKEYSFIARMYYVKIAYNLWKKKPIFGWGIRSFRKELYEMQAELNVKDPYLLGHQEEEVQQDGDAPAKYSPYPTRAHNDYVEMLSDGGLIGLALLLFFVGSIIFGAIQSQNYILLGGLVCLMIHGCLFYTLSTSSFVPYILLAGCVSNIQYPPYLLTLTLSCLGIFVIIKLAIEYVIKPQLAVYWIAKAYSVPSLVQAKMKPLYDKKSYLESQKLQSGISERESAICDYELRQTTKELQKIAQTTASIQNEFADKAINLTPSSCNAIACAVSIKSYADPWLSLHYMERSIHLFDGVMRLPEQWAKYGELQGRVGNWEGAKRSLKYSLYLNPCYWPSRKILKNMEEAEQDRVKRDGQITNLVRPPREVQAA